MGFRIVSARCLTLVRLHMQKDLNLTIIILIAGAGLIIFLTGLGFLFFRDFVSKNIRYFLPLPPVSVAAYIYVYNLYQHNNGVLPEKISEVLEELFISVGITTFSFAAFTGLLILFVSAVRKLF